MMSRPVTLIPCSALRLHLPLSVVHQLDIGGLSLEFVYTATPGFLARNQDLLSWLR